MNKLDNLLTELCPAGVEYVKLDDVLDYEQPTKYIVKTTDYDDSFEIPVLTAGGTFILGYTEEKNGIYKASMENPVIIFDDFTTSFHWVNFNFKVKSSAMKILKITGEGALFRYIYHCMRDIQFIPLGHRRRWIREYSQITIPLPPLPVQEEIVRILDNFTRLTTKLQEELNKELTARKKQYEYYREKLLTFKELDRKEA